MNAPFDTTNSKKSRKGFFIVLGMCGAVTMCAVINPPPRPTFDSTAPDTPATPEAAATPSRGDPPLGPKTWVQDGKTFFYAPLNTVAEALAAPAIFEGYKAMWDNDTVLLTDPSGYMWSESSSASLLLGEARSMVPKALTAFPEADAVCLQKETEFSDLRGHDVGPLVIDKICFSRKNAATIEWANVTQDDLPKIADSAWQRDPDNWGE